MQTIEVTNCAECPFVKDDIVSSFKCGLKKKIKSHRYSSEWGRYDQQPHPLCPLKTNQITVKLSENAGHSE